MPSTLWSPVKPFSIIYLEDGVRDLPRTGEILSHFPSAEILPIRHYKDLFAPSGQPWLAEKHHPALILAGDHQLPSDADDPASARIYHGAPVCQNFGNFHFYYTSLMMNCIYDCEYCYLQGMYPSANVVVFPDLTPVFSRLKFLLQEHPVYLCISYDTDLLAFEGVTGFIRDFIHFTAEHENLTVECRTKSANIGIIRQYLADGIQIPDRFIFAWTLSPSVISARFEHLSPDTDTRIQALLEAIRLGLSVRICFDPLLEIPGEADSAAHYRDLIRTTFEAIREAVPDRELSDCLRDVSLGAFRVTKGHLKNMRQRRPDSLVVQYPYHLENGAYSYPEDIKNGLTRTLLSEIAHYLPDDRIFAWH